MVIRFTPPEHFASYAGFIFDCDGTLADTMPAHFVAWRKALREGGSNFEFTWELFIQRAGLSMELTVAELSEQFQVALNVDIIARRQRELFAELSAKTAAVEEVLAFAEKVAQTHPVSVASGSSRSTVLHTLDTIRARQLFDIILTPEDVVRGKPYPDMFLLAAQKMGVDPTKCLVIEDGLLGIEAARRAQMDCVVVGCPPPLNLSEIE